MLSPCLEPHTRAGATILTRPHDLGMSREPALVGNLGGKSGSKILRGAAQNSAGVGLPKHRFGRASAQQARFDAAEANLGITDKPTPERPFTEVPQSWPPDVPNPRWSSYALHIPRRRFACRL